MTSLTISSSLSQIPVIDFAPFASGSAAEKQAVAEQIYQACHGIGFMYLKNHGVPQPLIDGLFEQMQQFFALPAEVKNQVKRSAETNCGYIGVEVEKLSPDRPWDLKEAFNVGKQVVWLPDQDKFRKTVSAFYDLCTTQVAFTILRAFAIALKLPENFFEDKHGELYVLRLLHYPPLAAPPQDQQIRAGEHTDYGSITLLFQDDVGGLEVCTTQGEWVAAPTIPGTIVVNVGDAMQRWTNNNLRSTRHRVVNPVGARAQQSRYSVALFCDPDPEVELACLPSCQDSEHPPLYPPILAGDYLRSRLEATY